MSSRERTCIARTATRKFVLNHVHSLLIAGLILCHAYIFKMTQLDQTNGLDTLESAEYPNINEICIRRSDREQRE